MPEVQIKPFLEAEIMPTPNRLAHLMNSIRRVDLRHASGPLTRAALGLSILTLGLAIPPSSRAQEVNDGQAVTTDVAGISLETDIDQVASGGELPDPNLLAQIEPDSTTPGVESLHPAQFTNILGMPGWNRYDPNNISRLPNGSLRISTTPNGTEIKAINGFDSIPIGDKGFEVQIKMNTVNTNNPVGVSSKAVLVNKGLGERDRLQVEAGFDNDGNLLVSTVDINNPVPAQRTTTLVGTRDNIRVSSDELRIQVVGTGPDEKINVYDGPNGPLLAEGLQLPRPFFNGGGDLRLGVYPQSVVSGPVMTVSSYIAGSY